MTNDATPRPPAGQPPIDTTVPHSARVWNYWLGGQDNYPADRAAGDQVLAIFPAIVEVARAQRAFLDRAISYLAVEAGLRQFLDAGSGLPTAGATHQIAQRIAPATRVVYADNDPTLLAHARSVLTSTPEGATDYVAGDLRAPDQLTGAARGTLDLHQPVGLVLLGVLGHVGDDAEARSIVERLMTALAPGSYLVLADGTDISEAGNEAQRQYNERSPLPYHLRSPDRIGAFFAGLDLVEPGVVPCSQWRNPAAPPQGEAAVGGVARKP